MVVATLDQVGRILVFQEIDQTAIFGLEGMLVAKRAARGTGTFGFLKVTTLADERFSSPSHSDTADISLW